MSTYDTYCSSCGAANAPDAVACFACGKPLAEVVDHEETHGNTTLLASGTLLHERYRLLNCVGEGGFAIVYRAEDMQNKRIVAIKSIGLAALNAQQIIDATDTYNRELFFGRALKHAHLPAFYDSFTDQDHWYLVVQYIDGPTLESYVQQRPARRLAVWEVLDIGIQICDVLTYLHTRQPPIIFRDIKPDNIMRTPDGNVYLVDFGIARHFRPGQRRDTQLLGSPGYAAPEQYGSAQTDERSDLYSLGATLHMLLTGSNTLADKAEPYALPATPTAVPRLEQLLARMQAQDPQDRPASAQEVRSALEDIAREENVTSLVPSLQQSSSAQWGRANSLSGSFASSVGQTPQVQTGLYAPPPPATKRKRSPVGWLVLVGSLVGTLLLGIFATAVLPGHPPRYHAPSFDSEGQTGMASPDKQVLTFGLYTGDASEVLDPVYNVGAQDLQIESLLYAGLTGVDNQNRITPALAQSWEAHPDTTTGGLDWTFHLRPGLKFSNGAPLTSADVAYSIDRAFSSPNGDYTYLAQYFKDGNDRLHGKQKTLVGDSLMTPDTSTLVIKALGHGTFIPAMLSTNCFMVVNRALVEKYGNNFASHLDEGGTSGPFMQIGKKQANAQDLAPNPNYFGSKPQLRTIHVHLYSDFNAERADFKAGLLSLMEAPDYDSLTTDEQNVRQVTSVSGVNYIGMNYLIKPFDNVKIRQAFALALDKTAIMDGAYKAGSLATNHIVPEGQPGYNPTLTGPAGVNSTHGDSVLAKRLLAEGMQEEGIQSIAQFPPITFTYSSGNVPSVQDEMKLIQRQWTNVLGITVKMDDIDGKLINPKINASANNPHGLQLWFSGWLVDYPDPQNWTTLQFSKGSMWNAMNYGQNAGSGAAAQQQVQDALLKADAMQDQQQRLQAYQPIEQHLIDDVAWLPISQNNRAELVQPTVRGYQTNGGGIATPDVMLSLYIGA